MAEELQGILDKINANGIKKAQAAGDEIINAAKLEAEKIIADAKAQADAEIKRAASEAEALQKRSESAISQAARDLVLALRSEMETRINRAVFGCVAQTLTPEFMAELIRELAVKFADAPDSRISVLCAVKDEAELSRLLRGALADSFAEEPKVFGDFDIRGGMEVSFRDGELYFDFTSQAISELIAGYVGPMLGRLVEGK